MTFRVDRRVVEEDRDYLIAGDIVWWSWCHDTSRNQACARIESITKRIVTIVMLVQWSTLVVGQRFREEHPYVSLNEFSRYRAEGWKLRVSF